MNEHGGHIHYPAFLGNKPITKEDVDTVIEYTGHRPISVSHYSIMNYVATMAMAVTTDALARIQQESR